MPVLDPINKNRIPVFQIRMDPGWFTDKTFKIRISTFFAFIYWEYQRKLIQISNPCSIFLPDFQFFFIKHMMFFDKVLEEREPKKDSFDFWEC